MDVIHAMVQKGGGKQKKLHASCNSSLCALKLPLFSLSRPSSVALQMLCSFPCNRAVHKVQTVPFFKCPGPK